MDDPVWALGLSTGNLGHVGDAWLPECRDFPSGPFVLSGGEPYLCVRLSVLYSCCLFCIQYRAESRLFQRQTITSSLCHWLQFLTVPLWPRVLPVSAGCYLGLHSPCSTIWKQLSRNGFTSNPWIIPVDFFFGHCFPQSLTPLLLFRGFLHIFKVWCNKRCFICHFECAMLT